MRLPLFAFLILSSLLGSISVSGSAYIISYSPQLAPQSSYTLAASSAQVVPGRQLATVATSTTGNIAVNPVTGTISGRITMSDGTTAIIGATVKVYQGTAVAGTATTNGTGDYSIANLNPATYRVEVTAIGYETKSQSGVAVTSGATTTVNISLAVPITYIYDDLGRLAGVIDPSGDAATYNYDAVGNLLSISRQSASQVSIIRFTPGSGPVGVSITIYGTGFSTTPSQNTVTFNGTTATVTSSSLTHIATSVPSGATTGSIVVTSPTGTATSSGSFTVTSGASGAPTITGFTPTVGAPGTAVTITGTNFDTNASNDRVKFNQSQANASSATTTSIATTVPSGTGPGRISVTTPLGVAVSSADFIVPPPGFTSTDIETTTRMVIGETKTVTISTANKIALVLFDGMAGKRVSFNVTNNTISPGAIKVYRPDRTILASRTGFLASSLFIDAQQMFTTGTYTIMIDPEYTNTGSITFTLYDVPADASGTITIGGPSVSTTVTAPGQNALITFSGTAGQKVSLSLSNWSIASCTTYIKRPFGTSLASTTGSFIDNQTLPETGTYTILVDPTNTSTGGVTLTLNNAADFTGTITPGGASVSVSITVPGQQGRLTFSGTAGQRVSLKGANNTFGLGALIIHKPDNSVLASISGVIGSSPFIDTKTLPTTGTYTVLVDPENTATGSITLTLYDVPADASGTITIGGSPVATSVSVPGQNAQITFSGTAGQKVSLSLSNWSIASCTTSIKKPDGTTLDFTSGSYVEAQTLPTTGTYTILVDPSGANIGGVTLTLNNAADLTGTITPGGAAVMVTTTISGQNYTLTFSGTASQRISLQVSSFSMTAAFISIKKPDGTAVLSPTYITGNTYFNTMSLPVTGTYTILVDPNTSYTGSATLTLYDVPADTSGSITVGGAAVTVTLSVPGQNGQLTFSGTSGQQVTVRVTSNTINGVTVKLLKPDGSQLTSSTSSSSSFNLTTQTLPSTGTYTIVIDPGGASTGSLNVSVTNP